MTKEFDVIIIGGSYAGLSAEIPGVISEKAKEQVLNYPTVSFFKGKAIGGRKNNPIFQIDTESGESFNSKKLLFATGLKDIMPNIKGFAECWGISILHCPYCHGYEVKNEKTGLIGNGDTGFELVKVISHWTSGLFLFTNCPSTLTKEQRSKIEARHVMIIETEMESITHGQGYVSHVILKDGNSIKLKASYGHQVRDIFVFCCYTGLAYADVKKLTREEITTGIDGEKWLGQIGKRPKPPRAFLCFRQHWKFLSGIKIIHSV